MRELLAEARENQDRRALLAIDLFCYRARKYVGAYLAAMGGADAIVFAGGIGENAPEVRARICAGLEWLGLEVDPSGTRRSVGGREGPMHAAGSRPRRLGDPDRRGAAHRPRHVPRRDRRAGPLLTRARGARAACARRAAIAAAPNSHPNSCRPAGVARPTVHA
jgi:hypothetical protein